METVKKRANLLVLLGGSSLAISLIYFWGIFHSFATALLFSVLLISSLAVGGRWALWYGLFQNMSVRATHLNWQHASVVATLTFIIAGFGHPNLTLIVIMAAFAPLFTLIYGLAKLRCWFMGCCSAPWSYYLPLLESLWNCMLTGVLLILLYYRLYAEICLTFGLAYPTGRIYFFLRRNKASQRWLAFNLLYGLFFLFLYLNS